MDDLDDFLNGQTPEDTDAPEALVETPEPEATDASGPPRDEHGRFAPKGDDSPAPEPSATPEPQAAPPAAENTHQIPPAALAEERRKRQELEARLAQYEQHLAQLQRQPEPEPFIPSVYEDENGFAQGLTEQAVRLAEQRLAPQLQQALAQQKIEMERRLMRQFNPDFEQVENSFWDMARENPVLIQEANRQPNPVQWAYDYAKKAQEVRAIGSLDLAAIKAAAVQEYLAQHQPPAPAAAPPQIPSTLGDAQSARGSTAAPFAGLPTLNDILGRK